ncbi:hypothetical protein [Chlorogloeopsis sp. ULAP02]|uniref:hypothetical protein n=1 Tax=Chlorogloeopsis sp. ULAP02 TaxID=3107926 RepID=UPI003134D985
MSLLVVTIWLQRQIDEGRAAYRNIPEPAILEPYYKLRQLHAIVWVYALLPEFPDWVTHAKRMLYNLRDRL